MKKTNILVVDDRPEGLLAVQAVLDNPEYNLITASSGSDALKCLLKDDFAVILMDVQMPLMNGFETAEVIKTRERSKDIPIVFMSAINQDEQYVYQGYEVGAVDYLLKPFDPYILRSKVAIFVDMFRKNALIKEQARKLHEAEIKSYTLALDKLEVEGLRRYQYLADALPQIVFRFLPNGHYEYFNKTWFDYTGLTKENSLGNHWKMAIHPDDKNSLEYGLNISMASEPQDFECRILKKDGSYRWHLFRLYPETDLETNEVKCWLGTATDIEERKQTEMSQAFLARAGALLVSSLNYKKTMQNIGELLVPQLADWCTIDLLDEDNILQPIVSLHVNPAKLGLVEKLHKKYLSLPASKIGPGNVVRTGVSEIYQNITDSVKKELCADDEQISLANELNDKSSIVVPLAAKGKIFGTILMVFSDSGRRYDQLLLKTAEEFGRRVALAYENSKLYQLAQESVQVRNDFLSIASHELNTPITSLKLQLQMSKKVLDAQGPTPSNERIIKSIDASVRQVDRLIKLVQVLLDVSRIQSGKFNFNFVEMDLVELLHEVVERNKELLINSNCELTISSDDSLSVFWDKTRIEQVIINLLMNAIKYAPGKIEVKIKCLDDGVLLNFRDYGTGIPSEKLKYIFDRFERATSNDNIGGLGLGLYIVKQIVEGHQGTIKVESMVDKGTSFSIHLPFRAAEASRSDEQRDGEETFIQH